MKNLSKYDIDCSKETTRPVYAKRYAKDGTEYLEKVDEINIEEDLAEKKLEIERIKEIMNNQERLKTQELLDEMTEEDLKELEKLTEFSELDTYEFLNKTNELKEIYNKMPEDIRIKYNNLAKFGKEYLPTFIKEQTTKIEEKKEIQTKTEKKETANQTFEELEKKIEELQNKINKGEKENV